MVDELDDVDDFYWFTIPQNGTCTVHGAVLKRIFIKAVLEPKGFVHAPQGYGDDTCRIVIGYGKANVHELVFKNPAHAEDAFRRLLLAMAEMIGEEQRRRG